MHILVLTIYSGALFILLLFGFHTAVLVWHYYNTKPSKPVSLKLPTDSDLPIVTIQLPIYNEHHVVKRILDAVCNFNYPNDKLEIQILDDSTDDTVEIISKLVSEKILLGLDIKHIHRLNRDGYKAGALKAGLEICKGEFVTIFDADFFPSKDFIRQTLPYLLNDNKIGLVQTRWEHLNEDYSILTRIQAVALDAHFAIEQQVRNRIGVFINFNGTAGIWRKKCILDAGNWHADTLTEDLDLSYRAQLKGWNFIYLNDVFVPAELPSEINGLKGQQFRWTKGAIETAKKHIGNVWSSKIPLRLKLYGSVHLLANGIFPLVLMMALMGLPMVVIKLNHPELHLWLDILSIGILVSMASFALYISAQKDLHEDWVKRIFLFPIFMAGMTGLAINNSRAVIEGLIGKKTEFTRTPKYNIISKNDKWQGSSYKFNKIKIDTVIELILSVYFSITIVYALSKLEISVVPFQLLFLSGFLYNSILSLRHAFSRA